VRNSCSIGIILRIVTKDKGNCGPASLFNDAVASVQPFDALCLLRAGGQANPALQPNSSLR